MDRSERMESDFSILSFPLSAIKPPGECWRRVHHYSFSDLHYVAFITEADLIMADHQSLQHRGVTPDGLFLTASEDLTAGRDPVLKRAAEWPGGETQCGSRGRCFADNVRCCPATQVGSALSAEAEHAIRNQGDRTDATFSRRSFQRGGSPIWADEDGPLDSDPGKLLSVFISQPLGPFASRAARVSG
jgi:hypothetical protein